MQHVTSERDMKERQIMLADYMASTLDAFAVIQKRIGFTWVVA